MANVRCCAVPHGHSTRDQRRPDPLRRRRQRELGRPPRRRSALVDLDIHPGVRIDVTERLPFGGPLRVRVGTAAHALGEPLTHLVHGRVVA
ncbi:MAG: ferrous iron transport protein A [Pseudonocardia sp.]|nr:ferrous iron transport protein A [Pseudonocardia sp.]